MLDIYRTADEVEALLRLSAIGWHQMEDSLGDDFPVRHAERGAEKSAKDDENCLLREGRERRSEPDVAHNATERSADRAEHPLFRVNQLEQVPSKPTEKEEHLPDADCEVFLKRPCEEHNGEAESLGGPTQHV